jgi:two-component system, sensor histidine kinase and response regulator
MDLQLPRAGGLEATRILKRERRTRGIPIAAHTASTLPLMATEAAASGCDAVIAKPIPPSDLVFEVHRLLASRR